MDAPSNKRTGVARFSGAGATSAKPGTARWYKQHMPERFNNTKITVRDSGGFVDRDSELIAARVLKWNEMQHEHHVNPAMVKLRNRIEV